MWTGEMGFIDSLVISALGMLVVFAALAAIAISIVLISKLINVIIKPEAPKAAPAAAAPVPAIDEEAYAVLMAAVSEEARLSGEGDIRIVSVKEL